MTYTDKEKMDARIILGIRNQDESVIPIENRTREALIETINLMTAHARDIAKMNAAATDALLKRLKYARKAKSLANRRADIAEKTMRGMLDSFKDMQKIDIENIRSEYWKEVNK